MKSSCCGTFLNIRYDLSEPWRAVDFISAERLRTLEIPPKFEHRFPGLRGQIQTGCASWQLDTDILCWRKRKGRRVGIACDPFIQVYFRFVILLQGNSYYVCRHNNCHTRVEATARWVRWVCVFNDYLLGTYIVPGSELWGWCWASDNYTKWPWSYLTFSSYYIPNLSALESTELLTHSFIHLFIH